MKTVKIILILQFIFLFKLINAQTLNPLHQTIASAKVLYKTSPGSPGNPNQSPQLMATPEVNIVLKNPNDVSKIYLKIINTVTQEIIYQVNYILTSNVITNSSGKKLFENNNNVIFISNGQALKLKPYKFEIQTEDNQNNLSTTYLSIQ